MSVEGQDEREWIVLCDAQSGAHLTVEPYPVLPETPIGIERGDYEVVVAKSRLVESEARERELEDWKDGQEKALAWAESASEQSRANLRRAEASEAREAVLVEALKEIVDCPTESEDKQAWGDEASLAHAVEVARSALAGVVEAEPDGIAQEARENTAAAAYEASEGKYGRPLAEPDGSERA